MLDPWDDADIAQQFAAHARTSLPRAPLNSALCSVIERDRSLRGLLGHAPPAQRLPVLLLAAIHFEVLGAPTAALAGWYPTIVDHPRRVDDPGFEPALRAFVGDRAPSIIRSVSQRHVQTNEVGRCALFIPPMTAIASETRRPLGHVDMGTSAGLNLLLPRLSVTYRRDDVVAAVVGDGPIETTCGVRGDVQLPPDGQLPLIARSIGVDPRPVDLDDDDAMRWLTACCWPDERDRVIRLRAAIEVGRSVGLDVRTGTLEDVDHVVAEVDPAIHPVVTTSWVMNYVGSAARRRWLDSLDVLGRHRDLDWVFAESPALTPELPHPPALADRHTTAVVRVAWRAGARTTSYVARAHPHGHWIHDLG